ncbi:MAG: hypothetical protein AAGN35_01040 [Bacteroidota bacterium]
MAQVLRQLAGILFLFGTLSAQNLVPNPSFENRNTCPTSISQFNGYVSNWIASTTASTDYSGCGFTGNSAIRNAPRTGQSSLGGWGGASHPSCPGSAYVEGAGTNLLQTMVIGQPYQVEFSVRVDPAGSATSGPNNCVDVGIYFYNTATPPTQNGWCCLNVTPQVSIPGNVVPQGGYLTHTATVIAGNWNAIIVGPFCNGNTGSAACGNYTTARMYFNYDDISVEQQTVLDAEDLQLAGEAHATFHALHWEVTDPTLYQTFALERSTDGVTFHPISEQLADDARQLYQYLDAEPVAGLSFYRLAGRTGAGEERTSAVVTLLREAGSAGSRDLALAYEAREQTLRFKVPLPEPGQVQVALADMRGRMLHRELATVADPTQEIHLPVAELAQGLYVLHVRSLESEATWQAKWVK